MAGGINKALLGLTVASMVVAGGGLAVSLKAVHTAGEMEGRCALLLRQNSELRIQLSELTREQTTQRFVFSVTGSEFSPKTLARANRNLLNIRQLDGGQKWEGQIGVDKFGHVIFSHPSYSVRAGAIVLRSYEKKHGINTIRGLIERFCEGNRDEYVAFLCKYLGVKPDQKISLTGKMHKLLPAMIRFETGESIGLEYTKIIDAVLG